MLIFEKFWLRQVEVIFFCCWYFILLSAWSLCDRCKCGIHCLFMFDVIAKESFWRRFLDLTFGPRACRVGATTCTSLALASWPKNSGLHLRLDLNNVAILLTQLLDELRRCLKRVAFDNGSTI